MKGFEPFRTWDETYVHTKHNEKDRHVLQVRAEGQGEEPWTWVRTQGKGRVFYTAYGHDARTWQNPGFHDLLERGIRWAVNKGEVFDSRGRVPAGLPPFAYDESAVEIPNYLPGRQWGTQGEPIRRMQHPLSPEESMRHLVVPRGFEPRLFAAEPADLQADLHDLGPPRPALDRRERRTIPTPSIPRTAGRDRITICEDTDGDGKADKFTVFAEGLNIPTSLLCANGGVIVLQAPDTLFLKDTDGDGKADVRKVLFTGWGIGDTHAGPSNLRWGLDNWVWGIVGYSGFRGTVGGERHPRSARASTGSSPTARSSSSSAAPATTPGASASARTGSSSARRPTAARASTCRSPTATTRRSAAGRPQELAEHRRSNYEFFPVTEKVRQVDWHGGFTAGAGHALYTARTYPAQYWNQTAFVAEPTGHLVATFTLQRKGSDVAAYYGWNLRRQRRRVDRADRGRGRPRRPRLGDRLVQLHRPAQPHAARASRPAGGTPTRRRSATRPTGGSTGSSTRTPGPPPALSLDPDDPKGLVAALGNDNQFWRMHAQRLLVERGKTDVVPGSDRTVGAIARSTRSA